ncbi:AMP-binding protein [Nostoc sp.]|uniref:AMP-binding protein n=1 Tax=Nostoc sp. TaxID=1180 RepID=UPI002FF87179
MKRTPDEVAVVFGFSKLTYQQLNCGANKLARYLRSLGVGSDVLVGVCVERSLEMVVGLLGILKAGGAYVPLDPDYPKERLSFMLSDGNIEFLGRVDYQIKIRGFRIELGEIESVLGQYPNVQNVVVVAQAEKNGSQRLVAYLIPQFADCQIPDLRNYLKERLPGYMIPSAFVTLDQFPQTPNGKIDQKALPIPTITSSAIHTPPCNQAEEKIAAVWRQVLDCEKLSIHDNFFEVGGHSLLVVQVHHLLSSDYPNLKIVDLFTYPSIHSLANYLLQQTLLVSLF